MAKRRQTEEFPKRQHRTTPPLQGTLPRQKQPGNARRADGNPQATGDGKRPIAGSLGSQNSPVPDEPRAQPGVTRKAPTLPGGGYLPSQDPSWRPPSSNSPGSRRDG